MKLKRLILDNHGVTSVDAALVAHDNIRRFAQQIRDFTFSFIAPLGTDYNYVSQGIIKC